MPNFMPIVYYEFFEIPAQVWLEVVHVGVFVLAGLC